MFVLLHCSITRYERPCCFFFSPDISSSRRRTISCLSSFRCLYIYFFFKWFIFFKINVNLCNSVINCPRLINRARERVRTKWKITSKEKKYEKVKCDWLFFFYSSFFPCSTKSYRFDRCVQFCFIYELSIS